MQTLQHEVDQSPQDATSVDHPVLQGLAADQAAAYVEEVRLLRQRVAVLETALEAAKAAGTSDAALAPTSEFTESNVPAVVQVDPSAGSNAGFAQAWENEDEISFEERVAEKAFFRATSVDEESRSWLLKD